MQLGSIDTHAHDVFTHSFVCLFVHPSIHPEHSLIDATTHLIIYACMLASLFMYSTCAVPKRLVQIDRLTHNKHA